MGRNRFEYSPAGLNELLAEPVIHPKNPAAPRQVGSEEEPRVRQVDDE